MPPKVKGSRKPHGNVNGYSLSGEQIEVLSEMEYGPILQPCTQGC